ncbi:hypothetical protein C1645_826718 [Glomus cerebriforme]|uniref:HECT domain-containing protein n=1 Tax=Glomus cerebriforme TaxID=658196 RepID=A0A397SVZ6_9GLOM|nr:hypothetical protein C1645_826718 [Glomus cerebriforme]
MSISFLLPPCLMLLIPEILYPSYNLMIELCNISIIFNSAKQYYEIHDDIPVSDIISLPDASYSTGDGFSSGSSELLKINDSETNEDINFNFNDEILEIESIISKLTEEEEINYQIENQLHSVEASWIYIQKQDNTKIETILKFITGTTRIPIITKINIEWVGDEMVMANETNISKRLPVSSTCAPLLILHQNYCNDLCNLFEIDMEYGFFESRGFDESVYRISYQHIQRPPILTRSRDNFIDLTIEENIINSDASDEVLNRDSDNEEIVLNGDRPNNSQSNENHGRGRGRGRSRGRGRGRSRGRGRGRGRGNDRDRDRGKK